MRTPADGGGIGFADVRKPTLFIIIVVCFADAPICDAYCLIRKLLFILYN